jgi:hypothetical protein
MRVAMLVIIVYQNIFQVIKVVLLPLQVRCSTSLFWNFYRLLEAKEGIIPKSRSSEMAFFHILK